MRKLSLLLVFLSVTALAEGFPGYMKGGKIAVTLKDGKAYSYSSDEYMVVPRRKKAKPKKEDEVQVLAKAPAAYVEPKARPNSLRFYGGAGPSGLSATTGTTSVKVSQDWGPVFGLGYGRKISERFSLEAEGFSNLTGVLGLGWAF